MGARPRLPLNPPLRQPLASRLPARARVRRARPLRTFTRETQPTNTALATPPLTRRCRRRSVTISGDRQLSALTAAAAAGRLPGLASIAALASRAADAAALARALPSLARGLPALRRLALRPRPGGAAAPLSGEDGAAAALALAGALCSAPALERLEVEAPGLPQVAAGALAAAALRDLPDLRSLAIGCNLGTDGSEALAAALASEPRAGARLQVRGAASSRRLALLRACMPSRACLAARRTHPFTFRRPFIRQQPVPHIHRLAAHNHRRYRSVASSPAR